MRQAIQLTNEKFGPLTAVVNCAGIGIGVRTVSKKGAHPLDQFEKVLKVAITSTLHLLLVRNVYDEQFLAVNLELSSVMLMMQCPVRL